jgi:DNA-binding SARP family transcriptional activator
VKFKILGPLEIAVGPERLEPGGTRQQIAIAMLLLSADRVVTTDRLLEAIYGEDLPPTCRSQAQISISSLRRLLAPYSREPIISTQAHGYVIRVDSERLDSLQFKELVNAARSARAANQPDQAVGFYRDALRLWRGPALDGLDSHLVRVVASRLDEQRIAVNEDRINLELELGRHRELVGEITELVEEFPLRGQLRGQLMLALYRSERTAEALQVYRQGRRTMIGELGIEPSERLQHLEHAILTSDPALDPPAPPVRMQPMKMQVPNLLPTDIADFTGRAEEIDRIYRHLIPAAGGEERLAVPVVVMEGKGGVGKTSIALHASHAVAQHFPDGQLFADLHGGDLHPVGPMQVLERFLRALGVPGPQIPEGLDERAEVYRNLLADRKVLVVLDDALGESQVSALLPGSGAAGVIITSRRRLAGLAGAIHITVNVFDADKSLELLARITGDDRVRSQAQAAAEVADNCGHLPLALRIAGARLAARPHWSIQQLGERLADETRRLDELRHGDMGIRPSISLTYESTGEQARRLFRRLALLELPVFSAWLSSALLDAPLLEAEDLLDDLVSAQLVETTDSGSGVHSHYRFHDLIRVFARERLAAEESAAERKAAIERALGALLYLAEEAHCRHYGGPYVGLRNDAPRWPLPDRLVRELVRDPLSWYDQERAVMVAGVRQAAQLGAVELCWSLAFSAITLFESRIYLDDWQETNDIALAATRKAHDVRGQAAMLYSIGSLNVAQHRFDHARQVFAEARKLFADADDHQGVALVTSHVALIDRLSGQIDDAARCYEQALSLFNKTGDKVAAAYALNGLAQVKLDLHDVAGAEILLSDALRLTRETQCKRVEAQVLSRMGEANLLAGKLAAAADAFQLALARARELADPIGQVYALMGTGIAKVRQAEFESARDALQQALVLAGAAGQQLAEARVLLGLSELAIANGDPAQAIVLGQRASGVFRGMGALLDDVHAHAMLSTAHAALGDVEAAQAASAEAAALTRKPGQETWPVTRQLPGSGLVA